MKKIITILAIIAMFSFQGCTGPEGPPGQDGLDGQDGIGAAAFDILNQDLFKDNDNAYSVSNTFLNEVGSDLHGSDMVLIYRKSGSTSSGLPVWQLIPRRINFPNGDVLDYDFDFTVKDYIISAKGNYILLNKPEYVLKQNFRVLIVPNDLISSINKNDYNAVINALNINESKIQKIEMQ